MRTRRQFSSSDLVPSLGSEAQSVETVTVHTPVLLHEAIQLLAVEKDDVVLDATLGAGGHALEIVRRLEKRGTLVGIDADRDAIKKAREILSEKTQGTVHFVEANFRTLSQVLQDLGIQQINKALFDLGWNVTQLSSGRGFSFSRGHDDPLVMTYASSLSDNTLTASRIVNEWSEESLYDILTGFGEEKYARHIARKIVTRREKKPFESARELSDAIYEAVPPAYRRGRIHPATLTFQALRIAVNDELGALQEGFEAAWKHLSLYGRIVVITFHSVEDRLVKNLMRNKVRAKGGRLLVKHPLTPSRSEVAENPRARSAKLRAIEKVISM